MFINQSLKFLLDTQAERKQLKYSGLTLSYSINSLNERDHKSTDRGIETTCHQETVGADFGWLGLRSVYSREYTSQHTLLKIVGPSGVD